MTPDQVRTTITNHQHMAQQDPERWHAFVDDLRKAVLLAVMAGSTQAASLASAVLEADDVPVAWSACA